MIKICVRCGKRYEHFDYLDYNTLCPMCKRKKKYWIRDKRGVSLSSWTEVALFLVLLMGIIGIIVFNMNSMYNQNNDASFGIATNETQALYVGYISTMEEQLGSGEANTGSGTELTLSNIWAITKGVLNLTWSFLTGTWITKAVALMKMPDIVGFIFRALYIITIIFILIKLILKVKP